MKEKDSDKALREELQPIAPGLSEMKREDGFMVPHNYFRELPDLVFTKIAAEEKSSASKWSWLGNMFKPKYQLAFASVLILIVAGVWYSGRQSTSDSLASISQEEALVYVLDNLHEFNSEDLISAGVLSDWDATEVIPVSEEDFEELMNDLYLDENAELIEGLMN